MDYWIIVATIIATIIAILPVFLIRTYLKTGNLGYVVLSLLCYSILTFSYIKIFTLHESTGSIYTFLQILQILLVTVGSIVLLNETMELNKIIGIILGILSIYYLNIK